MKESRNKRNRGQLPIDKIRCPKDSLGENARDNSLLSHGVKDDQKRCFFGHFFVNFYLKIC